MYEYRDKIERHNADIAAVDQENDKIEEGKEKEALDWAEEEERKEREQLKAKQEEEKKRDEEWMLEQLKKERGDDFGEDINMDFN